MLSTLKKDSMKDFKQGDLVTYTTWHGVKQKGIVKSKTSNGEDYFVVYHWNKDIKNFMNYTAAYSSKDYLTKGWR